MLIKNFIGQTDTIEDIEIQLLGHNKRKEFPSTIIGLKGQRGMGKTHLGKVISNAIKKLYPERDISYIEKIGNDFNGNKDLLNALVSGLDDKVIFIDEVQEMKAKPEQEHLRWHIERNDPYGRKHGDILWIFATTDFADLISPLRNRINHMYDYKPYEPEEMIKIVKLMSNSDQRLGYEIDTASAKLIAENSRFTPRTARNFLLKLKNEMSAINDQQIELVKRIFRRSGIYPKGLTQKEIDILRLLFETTGLKHESHDVRAGLSKSQVLSKLGLNKKEYEDIFEPYLLRLGLVETNSSGRRISLDGENYYTRILRLQEKGNIYE